MVRKWFWILLLTPVMVLAKEPPEPNTGNRAFVRDDARVLTEQEEIALSNKLFNYYDSTSTQIAVLIEESLEGDDLFGYTHKVARKWGIGEADKDNGVLIYVATRDRRMRIHVGRGLEGRITDAASGRITDHIMRPNFLNVGFYEGIDKAVDELILLASGEYKNDTARSKNGFPLWVVVIIIIIIVIVFSSFGDNSGTTYRNRRGGWIIGPGPGGYVGGGGGGFSGGGFGGFGGGGFGGGGASGSW